MTYMYVYYMHVGRHIIFQFRLTALAMRKPSDMMKHEPKVKVSLMWSPEISREDFKGVMSLCQDSVGPGFLLSS